MPSGGPAMTDAPRCNACAAAAVLTLRIVPRSASLTLFDSTPRDIRSCAQHIPAAKAIGPVLSVTPLSDAVTVRTVKD